jgi:hypothetical protein
LADHASDEVEQQLNDELAAVHLSQTSTTDSTPELYVGDTTSSDSNSCGSGQYSFSSPLGFLQAALPGIPITRLREALEDAGGDMEDVDMESVMEALLTSEYVRELEERGITALDTEDQDTGISPSKSTSWETVEVKKKKKPPPISTSSPKRTSNPKQKTTRGKTIPLVDVRQRQHIRPSPSNGLPVPDPWTQMSSLASHVASFLPPHEPSFFLSYFHNPDYPSPSTALRAALTSISESQSAEEVNMAILFGILDIIRADPRYDMRYPDRKVLLASDTQLSLAVTSGRGDDALDLVWLLHELDDDRQGNLEMGMYHCRPSSPTALPFSSPSPSSLHSPKLHSPVSVRSRSKSPSPSHYKSSQDPFRWQSVPIRKLPQTYPHSAYIASTDPSNTRRAFGGNSHGKGGKGDVGELQQQQQQRRGRMRERNDLLKQAAGAWKSGNKKNRGGEIAAYYAERAREVQEMSRKEQLEHARLMVEAKRYCIYLFSGLVVQAN